MSPIPLARFDLMQFKEQLLLMMTAPQDSNLGCQKNSSSTLQVEVALQQRQLEMADCAAREDYSGAAVARDAARRLELQLRTMQLEQERIDRTTIKYKLGE